jgi:hypothetical protein
MSAIANEDVSFPTNITWLNFTLTVIFTLAICVFVNAIMQPKLSRIEPVSSLKSPE